MAMKYDAQEYATRIATQVVTRRKAAGLSVRQAARMGHMHTSTWMRVERGDAALELSTLARVGIALGCHPVDLMRDTVH